MSVSTFSRKEPILMIDLLRPLTRLAVAAIVGVVALSHAQTAPLNDTGQTSCYNTIDVAVACDAATAGNTGTRPHQDGRYGRDAAAAAGALSKVGGGAAGFDFSCVLWNGTVINGPNCHVGLVANTSGAPSATPTTDWACTKDNVTGKVWSLQSLGPMDWYVAMFAYENSNLRGRCGGTNWRLPTVRELLSIVHNDSTTEPPVDVAYFPSTVEDFYWTAEVFMGPPYTVGGEAWYVRFGASTGIGGSGYRSRATNDQYVRLVHSGP